VATDSRMAILGRLRAAARAVPHPDPERRHDDPSAVQTLALFIDRLGAARATSERIRSLAEAPEAAARYLAGQNLPARLTVAPELRARLDFAGSTLILDDSLPVDDGAAVLAGCVAAVAETGTFVAASGPTRDPRLNYLAETLIILVGTDQVVPAYEEIWNRLRVRTGKEAPRLVSFITGPSRTADIEQTIEWGAHGPRRLHVLICDEPSV
jgi:L-lactate dehydrogenase complex protein LldG